MRPSFRKGDFLEVPYCGYISVFLVLPLFIPIQMVVHKPTDVL